MENRLNSFKECPVSLTITPKELSEAGFFYTGCNDRVICFCCGGGLNKWERGENAWTEHARHFPVCSYVMLAKDKKFIIKALGIVTEPVAAAATAAENEQHTDTFKENIKKEEGGSNRDTLCKVCYAQNLEVVLIPCRHFVTCVNCTITLNTCPLCRTANTAYMRAYI